MTDNNHPITPPPELVQQWARYQGFETPEVLWRQIATQAARWGANQELEACVKLLYGHGGDGEMIRRNRRPKPPSLKKQAFSELDALENMGACNAAIIRRALESLPD